MKLPLLISASVAAVGGVFGQTCNVLSSELSFENIFDGNFNQFANADLNLVGALRNGGGIRLTNQNQGNTITGFWVEKRERIADGFSATFDFSISGGDTDGLAFVVQNDKTVNTLGDGGALLGTSGSLENYLMLGIDTCSSRAAGNCNTQEVYLETKRTGNGAIQRQATAPGIDLTAGTHTARVDYLQDINTVQVFIDETQLLSVELNNQLETIFGSKFAFTGFTASNIAFGALQPATIQVNNLDVVQMNSAFRFSETLVPTRVDFDDFVTFTLIFVDSCNNQLPDDAGSGSAEEIAATIQASLTGTGSGVVLEGADVDVAPIGGSKSAFLIGFTMPTGIVDTFTLDVTIDEVQVQQTPFVGAVTTEVPVLGGLSAVGIGMLAALIVVLVIGLILITVGFRGYKKKLDEHQEDIEYGKTRKKIETIEKDIVFSENPMIAPLDELKNRLAANEAEIARLREGQRGQLDDDFTIRQLQEANEALRTEMNDLKRRQDIENAGQRISTGFDGKQMRGNGKRAEFGQEEA